MVLCVGVRGFSWLVGSSLFYHFVIMVHWDWRVRQVVREERVKLVHEGFDVLEFEFRDSNGETFEVYKTVKGWSCNHPKCVLFKEDRSCFHIGACKEVLNECSRSRCVGKDCE